MTDRTLNYDAVKREAPGAHPFETYKNAFGKYIALVDPCGDPDEFRLAVAMARQGYVPKFSGSSKTNQQGHYVFVYSPVAVVWR